MAASLAQHDVGIDRRLTDPGAEPAVGPRNDVLASDQLRVARDALSHQLGMLDEVGGRVDDAGNQHLALRRLHALEHPPLVSVARIGGLERDAGGARLEDEVEDVGQGDVEVVRPS